MHEGINNMTLTEHVNQLGENGEGEGEDGFGYTPLIMAVEKNISK